MNDVYASLGRLALSGRLVTTSLSEEAVHQAIANTGLSDAQARTAIANASNLADGLRAIGVKIVSAPIVPTTPVSAPVVTAPVYNFANTFATQHILLNSIPNAVTTFMSIRTVISTYIQRLSSLGV